MPLHLAPEVGYQITDDFAVAVQGRHQIIPSQGSKNSDLGNGTPAKGANSVLVKLGYAVFGDNTRLVVSAIGGIGEGFRLVIAPKRSMDPSKDLPRNDTIRGGPGMLGGGVALVHHVSKMFAALVDFKTLVGMPDSAVVVDVAGGLQFSF